jgi:hypothetical protein
MLIRSLYVFSISLSIKSSSRVHPIPLYPLNPRKTYLVTNFTPDFNVNSLRIPPQNLLGETRVPLPSQQALKDQHFIPAVPESLFAQLAPLPGKALAVYLVLWRQFRMTRSATVVLSTCLLTRYNLTGREKRLALQHLVEAGLITVETRLRRNPVVTLLRYRPTHQR